MTDKNKIQKWVTKHNFILEAGYCLSLAEQRVVIAGLSQIDTLRDTSLTLDKLDFIINADDYSDQFNLSLDNTYKEMRVVADRLLGQIITIYDPENKDGYEWLKTGFVSSIRWSDNHHRIKLTWSPAILPYLTQLKGQFHSYMLESVKQFKSQYSIRLFELLIQWENAGFREVPVEWIIERFKLSIAYKNRTSNIKSKVLEPAIKDINDHSNLWVKMGVRKRGNKIIAFQFNFGAKEEQPEPKKIELGELVQGVPKKLLNSLARPGETATQAASRIKSLRLPKESWQAFQKRLSSKAVDVKTQDMFPDLL